MLGLVPLGCFSTILKLSGCTEHARTAALVTLVFSKMIHVFECISENGNIFTVKYFSNLKLIAAGLISLAVITASVYLPVFQPEFSTVPLGRNELLASLAFAAAIPVVNCFVNPGKK